MRVVALVALAFLAGCAAPPQSAEQVDDVSVVTDPRDLLNGTAPGSHIHDYWGGRQAIELLRVQGEEQGSTCNGCQRPDGMPFESQRPAEGVIVPQGTRWVNGSFVHHSDGEDQFERLELWVKTARDVEVQRLGDIQSGVPFSIETNQEMNDPPHYILSLWEFELRAFGGDVIHVGGRYDWSVDAVRGLPLVPYPPHADRWNGATELDLLEDTGGTTLLYSIEDPMSGTSTSCYNDCMGLHLLADGVVVPYDTARLEVRLTVDVGPPAGIGLWYHGADTWEFIQAEATLEAPATYVMHLELGPSQADSPYAPQSLWEFWVYIDQPQPALQAWSGEYTLDVRALRA